MQSTTSLHPTFVPAKDCVNHAKAKVETVHDENKMDLLENVESDCDMQSKLIKT